jgi:hypothetical protein
MGQVDSCYLEDQVARSLRGIGVRRILIAQSHATIENITNRGPRESPRLVADVAEHRWLTPIHIAMGLFSSVIHIRDANAEAACEALCETVPAWKFRLSEHRSATAAPRDPSADGLLYIVSPLRGSWSTILQGHFAVQDAPWLPDLARSLSNLLATYTLALMVHDDDVLYYNLCRAGIDLDGYNSNPQYFETERLSEDSIVEQRHDPTPFVPLLPEGVNLANLQSILERGWWSAYDDGRVDTDGVQPDDEPGFVFEGERMIEIGNLLHLHGRTDGYPFAGWADDQSIEWRDCHELRFERA